MRLLTMLLAALFAGLVFWLAQAPGALDVLGDRTTAIVKPVIVPLVDLINKPVFVYLASAAILLSALVVMLMYYFGQVRPQLSAHLRAEQAVVALKKASAGEWQNATSAVERIFIKHDVLLSPWATYIQEAIDHGRLPTRRFSLFADGDQSHPLLRNNTLMSALPSYYTSIGLILTFIGLVIALYFAAKGFSSGDIQQSRQAIVQLLNASAFKFLTSVAALVSALLLSITHRLLAGRLRRRVVRLLLITDRYLQDARQAPGNSGDEAQAIKTIEIKLDAMIAELSATRQALVNALPAIKTQTVQS